MGRPRINPLGAEEWQEAVNAAQFGLDVDSCFQYGLLETEHGDTPINVKRCRMILKEGARLGYLPVKEPDADTQLHD